MMSLEMPPHPKNSRRHPQGVASGLRRFETHSPMGPFARWISPAYALAATTLLPWTLFLALTLPTEHDGAHWRLAWVGLDVGLFLMLAATAVAAARRSPWLEGVAMASAALLLCDAWFDVTTAHSTAEVTVAIVLFLLTELPLAALSIAIARRAEHALARLPLDRLSDVHFLSDPSNATQADRRRATSWVSTPRYSKQHSHAAPTEPSNCRPPISPRRPGG